ncbi:MAG: GNAT family N-acetyltransferase, partial [Actinomycetota bacterium]|nr:GNAT family N-acetyltransferase [Actinomycetota bacterium]
MSVEVRRAASDAEIAAAGEITAQAYQADRLIDPDDAYLDELADARRRAREAILLVATLPGARPDSPDVVVGTITMAPPGTSYAETAEPGELELRMLAVAPEARGKGVAEALMKATAREAVLLGFRRLVLSTMDSMAAAQRLYLRLGWTRVPERDWGHVEIHLRVFTWAAPAAPGAAVERATWPPVQVESVGGFEIGLSGGLTRRANSAVLVDARWDDLEPAELERRLDAVEADFRLAGLVPCVRVDAPQPRGGRPPTPGERVLAARGYRDVSETFVFVRELDGEEEPVQTAAAERGLEVVVADSPDEHWLALWAGDRDVERELGTTILTGAPALYLSAMRDGRTLGGIRVCCSPAGQATRGATWAGLSCLTVAADHRGAGIATGLTRRALVEAR